MASFAVSPAIQEMLGHLGLSWHEELQVYIFGAIIEGCAESQITFVVPQDDTFYLASWIGNRTEGSCDVAFLDGARKPDDGYSIEVVAQILSFWDAGTTAAVIEADMDAFVAKIFAIAHYAAEVDQRISENIERFNQLAAKTTFYFESPTTLVDDHIPHIISLIAEQLELRPSPGVWRNFAQSALLEAQFLWTEADRHRFEDHPWMQVFAFLEDYGRMSSC